MRKTIITTAIVIVLLLNLPFTLAETDYSKMTTEELIGIMVELETQNSSLKAQVDELTNQIAALESEIIKLKATPTAIPEPTATPAPKYPTLQKGSKGEDVRSLQLRLKELNYLEGNADGDFGKMSEAAVSAFQQQAGLPVTGIADETTQIALFRADAPKAKVYVSLDYTAVARDPDTYKGNLIKFSGKIVQVMESGSRVVFRIASKGNYDDVVYCTYTAPENYSRFLEDDRVTVYGTCTGIYTYTTIMGGSVTIPSCEIDRIELKK